MTLVGNIPLGRQQTIVQCPGCYAYVLTETRSRPGIMTWVSCFFLLNVFLCCVPFFVTSCLDTEHYCPNCGGYLGKYRAP